MHIALGQTVFSSDGQKLGTIDRVVLNPADNHVEQFIVHRGLILDDDKIIERITIDRVDGDRVHLTIDAVAARQLPKFERSYSAGEMESGFPEVIPGPYQSMILFSTPPVGQTYLDHGSLFRLDPLEGTADHPEPPVSEGGVVIGRGAEVFGSDDQTIGHVHEVEYDERGALVNVTLHVGLVRHHTIKIGAESIARIGDEEIILNILSTEVSSKSS
jgi:sporulation protein YlmC with PRC-barrel domain